MRSKLSLVPQCRSYIYAIKIIFGSSMEAIHVNFLSGRPPKTLKIVFFLAIQGCTQELRISGVGLNSKLLPAGSASTSEGYLSSENKQIVIDSILKLHSLTKGIKKI